MEWRVCKIHTAREKILEKSKINSRTEEKIKRGKKKLPQKINSSGKGKSKQDTGTQRNKRKEKNRKKRVGEKETPPYTVKRKID